MNQHKNKTFKGFSSRYNSVAAIILISLFGTKNSNGCRTLLPGRNRLKDGHGPKRSLSSKRINPIGTIYLMGLSESIQGKSVVDRVVLSAGVILNVA